MPAKIQLNRRSGSAGTPGACTPLGTVMPDAPSATSDLPRLRMVQSGSPLFAVKMVTLSRRLRRAAATAEAGPSPSFQLDTPTAFIKALLIPGLGDEFGCARGIQ